MADYKREGIDAEFNISRELALRAADLIEAGATSVWDRNANLGRIITALREGKKIEIDD